MPAIQHLDQFAFHHVLAQKHGVSLVIFTGPACGACRRLKEVILRHAELFAELNLFEVDAQQDMALVREFEVFHLPAMFVFRDGQFHCELQAEAHPMRLREAIDQALLRPAQEAP